ncbi:MAG: adenylate/guanylate cyclase domain-containing protein [Actinomycetota bacterium]
MANEIRYALSGDVHLAYRTLGDGPVDLVFVPPWFSNIDLLGEHPTVRDAHERFSAFSRVILYDRRGSGLSDRLCGPATLEEGMDDLLAVIDEVGAERVALFGFNESGTLSALAAATHPQRISSLILCGSFAATTWHEDYPWGQRPEERAEQVAWVTANWGTRELAQVMFPNGDERLLEWGMRWQRNSASPDYLPQAYDLLEKTDVRHVLGSIRVPTLVLHREKDVSIPVENGRYLAEHIPGSKYVELPGSEHIPFLGDWEALTDEVEEFLTGTRRARPADRVLATILFTDIVGSTQKAVELGDKRWRELLDAHDDILQRALERYQGRLVKSIGDGSLATFDGPARAIQAGCWMRDTVGSLGVQIRAGLHTGEVELRKDDVGGIAVHIGARVAGLAAPGELLVSGAVPPLVAGSGIEFEPRGSHELRGLEGEWPVYAVKP